MSQFDDVIAKCKQQMADQNIDCDENLLTAIAKSLGPSIYNKDSGTVATADKGEVETVKKNFLVGKLGCADGPDLDGAIDRAAEKIGKSNVNKLRPVFYYLLVKDLGKESVFA
ncbi:MAG: DUF2853 family protein [bacterium]|nr:DUF2853 family protein [bacterium]